jgi:hypothetical protein
VLLDVEGIPFEIGSGSPLDRVSVLDLHERVQGAGQQTWLAAEAL